jgi:carbonic anhydrase
MKKNVLKLKLATAIFMIMEICSIAQVTSKPIMTKADTATMTMEKQMSITPKEALEQLKAGNMRFTAGEPLKRNLQEQVKVTAKGQFPYAVVLSCIDSRTSSELIFDQGLGDIFNSRIAGNFVNTDIIGSMEFACKVAGAKVLLVVGHSKCGAVKGACDHVELGNLTHLLKEIEPAVDSVKNIKGERNSHNDAFVQAVAIENVKLTLKEIREKSSILSEMEKKGEIIIVGAMYDLETGKVEFFQN